jgi:hypothetical protein
VNPVLETVTGAAATLAGACSKYASESTSGISAESTARERGPCTARTPYSSETSSRDTRRRPRWLSSQPRLGRAAVSRNSDDECRKTTPSSMTKPRSSHQIVYCA